MNRTNCHNKFNKKNKKTKFSPQQQKMFDKLGNYLQFYRNQRIEIDILIDIFKIPKKRINTAIFRLRKQYRQIYNTKEDILSCTSKIDGYYKIYDAWNLIK